MYDAIYGKMYRETLWELNMEYIPGSRALAGPNFLSIRRVFVSNSQPIGFARFDNKSVNRGLPVLDQTPATGQKDRGLWGREWWSTVYVAETGLNNVCACASGHVIK